MKRSALLALTLLIVAASGLIFERQRRLTKDEPWYHASDVAMLANTGRPQLIELFHPD